MVLNTFEKKIFINDYIIISLWYKISNIQIEIYYETCDFPKIKIS